MNLAPNMAFPVLRKKTNLYPCIRLVRINHMSNCIVCHAPSLAKSDLVRGRVPTPGKEPPPLYYDDPDGLFVRADITYLRQEFSLMQAVPNAGRWPGNQRFDYFIRKRPLTPREVGLYKQLAKENKVPENYEHREALLFSLRELTGKNPGRTYEEWKPLLRAIEKR